MDKDEVLTFNEVQNVLKIGKNSLLKLLQSGELRGRKVVGKWRILRSELENYLSDFEVRE